MISRFKNIAPKLGKYVRNFSTSMGSTNLSAFNVDPQAHQFSKEKLTDFGELPLGEIPDALKYDREFHFSQLPNGVRVTSEKWPSKLATISVFIKCGSRQETTETSGAAHFLEHLNFKGTKNRTKHQFELSVENIGGQLNAYTSRENTSYTMTVFKENVPQAVEILGDMLVNSVYSVNHLESEKGTIYRELLETMKDQMETTVEASHFTSFRGHMMALPILGVRENIRRITQHMVKEYHATNYIGPNIVVVGAGNVNHEHLTELAEKYFGGLPNKSPTGIEPRNTEKPNFTPSILSMKDEELPNLNVGVFFEAPGWFNPDYYPFLVLQRVLGEYTQDKPTLVNLNSPDRQYNLLQQHLRQISELVIQKTIYTPYSDTGLFGSYFHGNPGQLSQMMSIIPIVFSEYSQYINEVEVFRAKNRLYNELLQHETGTDIAQSIGNQVVYLNRRVPRSEIARRVSNIDSKVLQKVVFNWFYDQDMAAVLWGPQNEVPGYSTHNRAAKRSPLGWSESS